MLNFSRIYKMPITFYGYGYNVNNPTKRIPIVVPDDVRNSHTWIFGTTRVGKTRLLENLVEQCVRKGESVVIIDPKGDHDLFNKVVQAAIVTQRYQDLIVIDPIYPEYSAVIDPLSYYYMIEEAVAHIVSGVEVSKEDKFFLNVAYDVSLAIVQALVMIAKAKRQPPKFNFNDIKNLMSQDDLKRLQMQINMINTPEAEQLSRDLAKIISSPPDYYNKISTSLRVALAELSSGNIGKLVGKVDENRFIKRLEEGKTVILYVKLGTLLTKKASYTLGKVILSMIQSLAGRFFASNRKITPPLNIFIDEAQSTLYVGIDEMFAKAGGAGVHIYGISQSINQIFSAVGEEYGRTILDNTNTKVIMRIPDMETAEYVAGHFGIYKRYTSFLSAGKPTGGMMIREVEEDFVKPQQVMELQPREFFLISYHGKFKGITADVTSTFLNVKYPDIKVVE